MVPAAQGLRLVWYYYGIQPDLFPVAKESSNPQVLRLVLQGLSAAWEPNMRCLTRSPDPVSSTSDGENTPTQSLTCSSPIISVTNINKSENSKIYYSLSGFQQWLTITHFCLI